MKFNTFVLFLVLCVNSAFSQEKYPRYSFGAGVKPDTSNQNLPRQFEYKIYRFYFDATFTLTTYSPRGRCSMFKTERRGSYSKSGDTLFLADSCSVNSPLSNNVNIFSQIVKERELQLYPAKFIITNDSAYYSGYHNLSQQLYKMSIAEMRRIEKAYTAYLSDPTIRAICY